MPKKHLKGKIPKKQQVFNKFLFDSHLEALRAIELMQESIANMDKRLSLEGKAQQDQNRRLTDLEKEIKDQREDYHSHIRQLVTENEQVHKNFSAELSQVAGDTNKALIAMKQTNDVAREASNRQAAVITKLHNQIRELAADLEKKKASRPKKVK